MDAKEKKHALALEQFSRGLEADEHNRLACIEDMQFVAGEQWPSDVKNEREQAGRPTLTINRMPAFVRQVANEVRMKPPAIKVIPAEDGDVETAEVIEGLIRHIEAMSKAKRVYARGIEDAARGNMGFFRVKTQYANDDTFDLDIRIETIDNPLSVVFDPGANDPMLSDARFCFVIDTMQKADFKRKYGESATSELDGDATTDTGSAAGVDVRWNQGDVVQVAEYWCVEDVEAEIVQLDNGDVIDVAEYDKVVAGHVAAVEMMQQAMNAVDPNDPAAMQNVPQPEPIPQPVLDDTGSPRTRKVKRKKVQSYIMSGSEFLEGPFDWPGDRIPIIPVWGEEYRVKERKMRASVVTFAKDAARMINYWRSASVEALALAPKSPWLVTPKQIEGVEALWKSSGRGNPAVLVYNPDPQAGAPQRVMPAQIQSAMLQEAALAQDDLKATTGIFDAALGAQSNETSGKAILARQREGDVSTYVFLDNLLAAVEECGRVILSILPKVYDTQRQIRILGKKNESAVLTVNDGSQYDLTRGKYDVHIITGPSVTTQRQAASEAFVAALNGAPPELAAILLPRMFEVLDIPDAKEIAEELKGGARQPPQPNPKDVAAAQKSAADARKTNVETDLMIAQYGQYLPVAPTAGGSLQGQDPNAF